jgi:2-haloacid dehalogenase
MVASFTILTTSLVVHVSRKNNITWDCLISCEMIGIYKPHLKAYQTAARWLALEPHEILMVACHNFDLMAARAAGYRSVFVRRPTEWGPSGPPDPVPNPTHDLVVDTFFDLAQQLGA